jgi:hypothetical protein
METTKDPWKDKYGYDIPRCCYVKAGDRCKEPPITGDHFCPSHHPDYKGTDPKRRCQYINPITADGCESPPQIGKSFCYSHDPEKCDERREAQSKGGRNRRQPEPPPVIPLGLPHISLQTPRDAAALYEETINFVRTGEMDRRIASLLGYLTMGWLHSFQVGFRTDRQVIQDEERAAERAEKKAEREEAQAAKAQKEAEKATEKEAAAAAEAAEKEKPQGWFFRNKYGQKRHITEVTMTLTTYGPDARTEVYRAVPTGLELVSTTRPDLVPISPDDVNPEKHPEIWALCQKAKQARAQAEAEAEAQAAQQPKPENHAAQPGPDDLTAHNFAETAPPESAETKPGAQNETAQKPAAENGTGAPNQAERRLPRFLCKPRMVVTKRPATEHDPVRDGLSQG